MAEAEDPVVAVEVFMAGAAGSTEAVAVGFAVEAASAEGLADLAEDARLAAAEDWAAGRLAADLRSEVLVGVAGLAEDGRLAAGRLAADLRSEDSAGRIADLVAGAREWVGTSAAWAADLEARDAPRVLRGRLRMDAGTRSEIAGA